MSTTFLVEVPRWKVGRNATAARTTIEQREAFIDQHAQGETYAEIGRAFGVSWQCVRYWWQRFRRGEGKKSQYQRERHALLMRFSPLVRYAILRLKLKHPHWGPRRLRYQLERRPTLVGQRLPSATQIGRYLHQWVRIHRPVKRNRLPQPLCHDRCVCISVGKWTSNLGSP